MAGASDVARAAVGAAGVACGAVAAGAAAYLNVLGLAARRRHAAPGGSDRLRLVVCIPAHDEEHQVATAVRSALASEYPAEHLEVVVVADNCTDATARVAAEAGATAWERHDLELRGKGHALAWAFERVAAREAPPDAVVVLDADCTVSTDLVGRLAAQIAAGAPAAQARYAIDNPGASTSTALRAGAFALMNDVRPRGKEAFGLSAGLMGTGMAFTLDTLRAVPWDAFSITEDREYHLRLVESGRRVHFEPVAVVFTPAPEAGAGADTQERRWDAGNVELARRWVPRIARARSLRPAERAATVADLVAPPQAVTAGLWALGLALGALARSRRAVAVSLLAGAGQASYVVGGLTVADTAPATWRALPRAPGLVLRRLVQVAGIVRRPPTAWERTERGG